MVRLNCSIGAFGQILSKFAYHIPVISLGPKMHLVTHRNEMQLQIVLTLVNYEASGNRDGQVNDAMDCMGTKWAARNWPLGPVLAAATDTADTSLYDVMDVENAGETWPASDIIDVVNGLGKKKGIPGWEPPSAYQPKREGELVTIPRVETRSDLVTEFLKHFGHGATITWNDGNNQTPLEFRKHSEMNPEDSSNNSIESDPSVLQELILKRVPGAQEDGGAG